MWVGKEKPGALHAVVEFSKNCHIKLSFFKEILLNLKKAVDSKLRTYLICILGHYVHQYLLRYQDRLRLIFNECFWISSSSFVFWLRVWDEMTLIFNECFRLDSSSLFFKEMSCCYIRWMFLTIFLFIVVFIFDFEMRCFDIQWMFLTIHVFSLVLIWFDSVRSLAGWVLWYILIYQRLRSGRIWHKVNF